MNFQGGNIYSASNDDIPKKLDSANIQNKTAEMAEHPKSQVWEWLIVLLICLACVGYWSAHHRRFYIPHPDYHSFEETASDIWSGQMPSDFKRMPLFPSIFGGLAQILPVENPYMEASLILNMVFSAGVLLMLYLFLRGLIGRVAIVPIGFVALSTLFLDQALLPILEPFMLCMILLTLWLFAKGSRWQYVAAFFAALTRYEASALIFILFLLNTFSVRSRLLGDKHEEHPGALFEIKWGGWKVLLKNLVFAALASTGFIAWMALSLAHHEHGNPHIELMQRMGWPTTPRFFVESAVEIFHTWAYRYRDDNYATALIILVIAAPCVYGAWLSFRRFGKVSAAILIFAFLYVMAQVVYGIGHWRYIYPVLWIPAVYFSVGWAEIINRIDQRYFLNKSKRVSLYVITIFIVMLGGSTLYRSYHTVDKSEGTAMRPLYLEVDVEVIPTPEDAQVSNDSVYPAFWLAVTVCLFAFGIFWGNPRGIMAFILAFMIATTIGYGGAHEVLRHAEVYSWRRYYRYYQFLLAGRWLEQNLEEGERATVLQSRETLYAVDLPKEAVVKFSHLRAENIQELMDSLEEHNIKYVIYTWRGDHDKEDEPWSWVVTQTQRYDVMAVFGVDEDLPGFEFIENLGWLEYRSGNAPRVFKYVGKPDVDGELPAE